MNTKKLIPIIKGAVKHIPGIKELLRPQTGGTIKSSYCYTVWMRHLKYYYSQKGTLPQKVAELGPGDSLGIGLAALLSGCKSIYALDVIKYWDEERNLTIFDELVDLFEAKEDIPDSAEYPFVRPRLNNYDFSDQLLPDQVLNDALSEERVALIRQELQDIDNPNNQFIKYQIPWSDAKVLEKHSVDFIFSQAVLEHVEDLDNTYRAMKAWLKPGGLMSHTIDFRSHSIIEPWNGHWTFSALEWEVVKGGKEFLINRQPLSYQVDMHTKYDFDILTKKSVPFENELPREKLASNFQELSEEDLTTSVVFLLSESK